MEDYEWKSRAVKYQCPKCGTVEIEFPKPALEKPIKSVYEVPSAPATFGNEQPNMMPCPQCKNALAIKIAD